VHIRSQRGDRLSKRLGFTDAVDDSCRAPKVCDQREPAERKRSRHSVIEKEPRLVALRQQRAERVRAELLDLGGATESLPFHEVREEGATQLIPFPSLEQHELPLTVCDSVPARYDNASPNEEHKHAHREENHREPREGAARGVALTDKGGNRQQNGLGRQQHGSMLLQDRIILRAERVQPRVRKVFIAGTHRPANGFV
jgi:hypothetical protein